MKRNVRLTKHGQRDRVESRIITETLKNKTLIILICVIAVVAISYGMLNDNNLIFIVGLLFVIGGYLLIRRRIKDYIKKNH